MACWIAFLLAAPGDPEIIVIVEDNASVEVVEDSPTSEPAAPAALTTATATYASRLALDLNFETSTGEDVIEWWHLGGLKLDHRLGEHWRGVIDGRVRWGVAGEDTKPHNPFLVVNARNPKWAADVELREGYVSLAADAVTVHLGQRLFTWGKNELGAPADVLNPIDARYDLAGALRSTRDAKVPVFALDTVVSHQGASLELVVLPFFTANKLFLYGRDFALAPPGSPEEAQILGVARIDPSIEDDLQLAVAGTEVPQPSPDNWSAALRGTAHAFGWDVAATAYYGWDRTPRLDVDPDLALLLLNGEAILADPTLLATDPVLRDASLRLQQRLAVGEQVVRADFQRWWLFAFEGEGVVGDVVVRADVGFTPGRVFYDSAWDEHARPSGQAVLGAEYTYGTTLYAALTMLGTAVFRAPAGATLAGLETTAATPPEERTVWSYGVGSVVRWSPEDWDASAEVAGVYRIEPGDWVVTTQLSYRGFKPHILIAGMLYLDGRSGSLGARYQRNGFAYAGYRGAW